LIDAAKVPAVLNNLHPNQKYFWQVKSNYWFEGAMRTTDYSEVSTFVTTRYARLIENGGLNMNIYPNPASSGSFTISVNNESEVSVEIYNMVGTMIYSENSEILNMKKDIDLSSYSGGIYFVKIKSNNETKTAKLIIQ
jgi:hypothetical protein